MLIKTHTPQMGFSFNNQNNRFSADNSLALKNTLKYDTVEFSGTKKDKSAKTKQGEFELSAEKESAPLSQEELDAFVEKYDIVQRTWDAYNAHIENSKKRVSSNDFDLTSPDFNVVLDEIAAVRNENYLEPYDKLVISVLTLKNGEKPFGQYCVLFSGIDGSVDDDYMKSYYD